MIDSEVPPPLHEGFTLHKPDNILDRLRLLELRRAMLSAAPVGSMAGIVVTVRRVFPDRKLFAVETGAQIDDIKRLLRATQVVFSGRVDGIEVRFEVPGLREAILDGHDLLAVPIPETLFWLQRRRFFRAIIPRDMPIKCQVTLPNDESHWFEVINLSIRGIALLDRSGRLRVWGRTGQTFANCRLDLPGFETERFHLEIRDKLETSIERSRAPTVRVGFSFRDLRPGLEAKIQRLLNEIETRARRERCHLDLSNR